MIVIRSEDELDIMRVCARVTGAILRDLGDFIKPGMSTWDVDRFIEDRIHKEKMIPTFKGYGGFPAAACVSVNEEVVHGIPSKDRILRDGDIVSVDTGATYKGYASDAARTYAVGDISDTARHLINTAEAAFFEGIKFAKKGRRLSDISHAIQVKVEGEGFGVIRDYVGHGIGRNMHEEPQIPNYGKPGKGPRIAKGMVFAIEPMITEGGYDCETLLNNWTVVTQDGKMAAHYENSVIITDDEPELITLV